MMYARYANYLRPYKNIEAVAAVGSKYRIRAFGDEKSLGAAAMSPFLDDRPAELMEALRCRDIVWWLADDIILYVCLNPSRMPRLARALFGGPIAVCRVRATDAVSNIGNQDLAGVTDLNQRL